jgi:hypothetical protein
MILRELLGTRLQASGDEDAYASMALPQPDTEPELLGTAAAAVVDDWAAARPATPRRRAAEKRMFAVDLARRMPVEAGFVDQGILTIRTCERVEGSE